MWGGDPLALEINQQNPIKILFEPWGGKEGRMLKTNIALTFKVYCKQDGGVWVEGGCYLGLFFCLLFFLGGDTLWYKIKLTKSLLWVREAGRRKGVQGPI